MKGLNKKEIVLEKFEFQISHWIKMMVLTGIGSLVSLVMLALISDYNAFFKAACILIILFCIEFGIWLGLHLSKKIYIEYTTKEKNNASS